MSVMKISDNVYSVGVINPNLRIFDIVMASKFGTSYNAYLVTGSKNVLIDTVHVDFFNDYLYNIGSLVDVSAIDYIVMNHTELDHSGSLIKLLSINPEITVLCTAAAQKYLRQILNRDFKCLIIKHGDTLDLETMAITSGNCACEKCAGPTSCDCHESLRTLKFIVAPMLHWPDSMMTYLESEGVLFSCDFLGAHFCEPRIFDSEISPDNYKNAYMGEFKYYYDGIFGPFKQYVRAGLDKLSGLNINAICPSHGPVIVEGISERMADYRRFSSEDSSSEPSVVVLYASAYRCTKLLAEAAFESIKQAYPGVKIYLIDSVTADLTDLVDKVNKCNAFLIGTCTINKDAPKVIWDVLCSIDAINSRGKLGLVFGSFGWSGEAIEMVESRLRSLNFKLASESIKVNFMPTEADLQRIHDAALQVMQSSNLSK